jgi:transposase-like protein
MIDTILDYPRRRLTKAQLRRLFDLYLGNCSASQAAEICGVNRNTAMWHYRRFREAAARHTSVDQMTAAEVDELYMGCLCRKSEGAHKRGRSAEGKIILVGAVDRVTGLGTAEIIEQADGTTLRGFIARTVHWLGEVVTDGFAAYKGLNLLGYIHKQVNHAKGIWKRGDGHTNRIENFWRQLRRNLARYNCAPNRWREKAAAFIKEAVFFFNFRGARARMKALGVAP